MDMKKILENMDQAAAGEKPAAGKGNVNDMKTILESIQAVEECGPMVDEGPMPTMPTSMPPKDDGSPVSMNVSINARGKDHVADLIDMMKNAGVGGAKEIEPTDMPISLPTPKDMDMLDLPMDMDGPDDMNDLKPGIQKEPCKKCGKVHLGNSSCAGHEDIDVDEGGMKDELIQAMEKIAADDSGELLYKALSKGVMGPEIQKYLQDMYDDVARENGLHPDDDHDDIEQKMWDQIEADYGIGEGYDNDYKEDYANEPDPQYGDMSDAIPDGNDLNRKKKAYAATQDGDNPMAVEAIKATLMAALAEKKKPDANKNGIPDYAEDGKGPNDLAKGKKGSKPKKGEVPPQFKKNVKEAEEAKKLPSAKDVKKMHDDGKSKQQIMAAYSGCDKAKMEKLYASSCSGH